jgi:hypothetical protein
MRQLSSTIYFLILVVLSSHAISSPGHDASKFDRGQNLPLYTNIFIDSLTESQRAYTVSDFQDAERRNASGSVTGNLRRGFRFGMKLEDMTTYQQHLVTTILSNFLSKQGMTKIFSTMVWEHLAKEGMEDNGQRIGTRGLATRSAGEYYLSIFGEPDVKGFYAIRFEGHHLSVNVTINDGEVVSIYPLILGGSLDHAPDEDNIVLLNERDLLFGLFDSIKPKQRDEAMISEALLWRADATSLGKRFSRTVHDINMYLDVEEYMTPERLSQKDMTKQQRRIIHSVFKNHLSLFAEDIVTRELKKIKNQQIFFGFKGDPDSNEGGHLFRLNSEQTLAEFAYYYKHIHTKMSSFNNNFGDAYIEKR